MKLITLGSEGVNHPPSFFVSASLQELQAHSRLVLHQSLGQVHSDWVRRVKFVPLKDFIVSCSGSGKDSLVVRDVDEKKRKTYVFRVAKVRILHHTLAIHFWGQCSSTRRLWGPWYGGAGGGGGGGARGSRVRCGPLGPEDSPPGTGNSLLRAV